eukprot:TRINITY_DN13713_c0_g2_i1.p1 TRINITY_DN13713_c0_g2~~TRINITY_DN13713_c0_g2_i1.p1  ORF type:complete len:753 (+),score=116.26 TRINITY_DN13713_c0_g2_i1:54-2312(+)
MSDSYSNDYTDDEEETDEEEATEEDDTHGGTSVRLFDSAEAAVAHALETGEYKAAKSAEGQEYWYNSTTKATTWNLKRELADRVKPSIGGDGDSVASLGLGLSVSTSSLMRRREERRIKEEVHEREQRALSQQPQQPKEKSVEVAAGDTSISNVSPIRSEDARQSKQPTPQSSAASPRPLRSKSSQRQQLLDAVEANLEPVQPPAKTTALELSDFSDISEFVDNPPVIAPRATSKKELRSFGSSAFGEKVPTPKSSNASRRTSANVTPRQALRRDTSGGIHVTGNDSVPKQPSPPAARRTGDDGRHHIPLLPTQQPNKVHHKNEEDKPNQQPPPVQHDIISQLMMAYLDLKNSSAQRSLQQLDSELQSIRDTPGSRVTEKMYANSVNQGTANTYDGHSSLNRQIEGEVLDLVLLMMGSENRSQTQATAEGTQFSRMLLNRTTSSAGNRVRSSHVVQKLNENDSVPCLPETVKTSGHQVTFSDTTAAELEMAFREKDSLHQLCLQNLTKYIIDRLRHSNKHTHASMLRVLITDLTYCLTQVVQNQGGKNYPTGTYYIKYYRKRTQNESIVTTYLSTLMHCLPYENVLKGQGSKDVLSYRQEYWVTKSHVIECILALQQTQHRLEFESVGMSRSPESDISGFIGRDVSLQLSIHTPEQTDAQLASGGPAAASLLSDSQQSAQGNPMSLHVLDTLVSDLKVEAFSSTNTHLSTQLCSTYLNKTIHEVLLDPVVKKGILSKTLKAMGVSPNNGSTQ